MNLIIEELVNWSLIHSKEWSYSKSLNFSSKWFPKFFLVKYLLWPARVIQRHSLLGIQRKHTIISRSTLLISAYSLFFSACCWIRMLILTRTLRDSKLLSESSHLWTDNHIWRVDERGLSMSGRRIFGGHFGRGVDGNSLSTEGFSQESTHLLLLFFFSFKLEINGILYKH